MTCSFLLFVLTKINIALHASKDSLLSDEPPKYSLADCATAYDPCTLLPVTFAPPPPRLQVDIPSPQIFSPKMRALGHQNLDKGKEKEQRKRRRSEREKAMAKDGRREESKGRGVGGGERWSDRRLEGLKRGSRSGTGMGPGKGEGWRGLE